jgi:orotate phosphoribosyltransferase-like protein
LLTSFLPAPLNIHNSGRHYEIPEGEPGTFADNFPMGTDERVAVIDDSAGFAAKEISIDISNAKGARAFQSNTLSNLILTEGEMTCAQVKDQVNAT